MLEQILDSVRDRIPSIEAAQETLRAAAASAPPPRAFESALMGGPLGVIAEIKRRSPSAGDIANDLDPVSRARMYEEGGAAAISVLTEPEFFGGSLEDLAAVRAAVTVPVLRKDFVLHPAQIWEARAHGADAVLLIVAALTDFDLEALVGAAGDAGMSALVEAHTAVEARRAIAAGARIVGVNNRDLHTFVTDLGVAESIAGELDEVTVKVAESGVSSVDGAERMAAAGYDAVLVGEAVVRAEDPAAFIASLIGGAS